MSRHPTEACPASLPGTCFFDFPSPDPENGPGPYRVFVHAPEGEPPSEGWPVLYMIDGNAVIATAVDALRAQASFPKGTNVSAGILVAIGYPVDGAYDPLRRSWDMSPPPGAEYPPFHDGGPVVRTGGGEGFLAFILATLRPWLGNRYKVNADAQSLFGHSFGGLFTIYALARRPDAFRNWISVSPALYWEEEIIRTFFDQVSDTVWTDFAGRVHLSAGEFEGGTPAPFEIGRDDEASRLEHRRKIKTIDLARDLASEIRKLTGRADAADFELFAGENHMSVLSVAVNRAIQRAFAIRPTGAA